MTAKFILGILIVVFTAFCGYILSKKYRRKKLFFAQFYEFNERFLTEITYARRPLGDFFLSDSYKGEFGKLAEKFFQDIQKNENIYAVLQTDGEYAFLTKEEKAFVGDYFSMLGKGDSASQKAYFSNRKDGLAKLKSQSETACKKYGDLYIKLGFLCGLLILVLIL